MSCFNHKMHNRLPYILNYILFIILCIKIDTDLYEEKMYLDDQYDIIYKWFSFECDMRIYNTRPINQG